MKYRLFVPLALLAVGFVFLVQPAKSQDYSNIRIVRLSFVEGAVQYQRPGQDWEDASLNLPIQEGFALRTADGYAEVEFENSLTMRLGTNSTVGFTILALLDGGRVTRLTISQGTAIISAKLGRADAVSVAVANLSMKVPHKGGFRVDVSPTESWVTVSRGKIEVDSGSGTVTSLGSGHTLHEDASGSGSPEIARSLAPDAFDKWVSHREDAVNSAQSGTADVLSSRGYTVGFADLYNYGLWSYLPGIGAAWMPYGMGAGWMPFVNGQWQFMGGTGWNWVSGEPWGWLPYHFGSWVNAPGMGWAWLPVGANSWMPATASWVQVNNQLGWIPNAPPQTSKPTQAQQAAAPATVILAGQGASGAIRAGSHVPLAQAGMSMRAVPAPSPRFIAPVSQPTQTMTPVTGSAGASTSVQPAPTPLTRGVNAPASLRTPSVSAAQPRLAGLRSAPAPVLAPHSLPAPAISRGASVGGFSGGFGGAHGGGGGVGMNTAGSARGPGASAHGPTMGSASRSGGFSGRSSAGHR
ncbi:MAG: FecR domain-containing protein [Acidobacteriia bacterium]|nr:FecR domain-containing protein [Terriglobia bacterium]